MIHKLHFPKPPLSHFVENLWLVEGYATDFRREKILPDGAIELIIDLDTNPKTIFEDETSERFRTVSKGWISGERTRYIVIGAEKNQSIVNLIEEQKGIEWAAIASDCGYYDQAHFIHEFQAFSGLNPSAYLTQRGEYVNFIPIAYPA